MRIGEERAKGYAREDFWEVFRRYIPKGDYAVFRAELLEEAEGSRPEVQDRKTAGSDEVNLFGSRKPYLADRFHSCWPGGRGSPA